MIIMNTIKKIRWRIPVYAFWLTVIAKILIAGESSSFLRPEFIYILILGCITLLIFIFTACFSDSADDSAKSSFLHMAIMVLPLFYYLNAQGEFLGKQAYEKRRTGLPAISAAADTEEQIADLEAVPSENGAVTDATLDNMQIYQLPAQLETDRDELTILDIYDDPEKYMGKNVMIKGMVHKDDAEITDKFGSEVFLLYRFVITCCAADAIPAGMLVDAADCSSYHEGDWIAVQGTFIAIKKDEENIPMIKAPTITKINAPENPYLY